MLRRALAFGLSLAAMWIVSCGWGFEPGHDPNDPMVVKLASVRASIPIGDTLQLTATVTGDGVDTVMWSVNGIIGP